MRHRLLIGAAVAAAAAIAAVSVPRGSSVPDAESRVRADPPRAEAGGRVLWSDNARAAALERAAVLSPAPAVGTPQPPGWRGSPEPLVCRFKPDAVGGTTPKFECTTETGETLKVKYGGAEPHAEVAATRLMRALGFPADDVAFVERVRCHGCPAFPFLTMKTLGLVDAEETYGRSLDYTKHRDVLWAAVERKHPGIEIETDRGRGWGWFELRRLRAPAAHVDALRLAAMFLAHWDNKAENQRLACLDVDRSAVEGGRCQAPVALVQDLGATFGPRKVNLRRWRAAEIWADRASCRVSMASMPHGGGTFPAVQVSEGGRQLLAERLSALEPADIRALFEAARFPQHDGHPVEDWVQAFEARVREIREGPPCPS